MSVTFFAHDVSFMDASICRILVFETSDLHLEQFYEVKALSEKVYVSLSYCKTLNIFPTMLQLQEIQVI